MVLDWLPPGEVLIDIRSVHPKGDGKQEFFQGHERDIDTRQVSQVPCPVNIPWRRPFQSNQKDDVVNEE